MVIRNSQFSQNATILQVGSETPISFKKIIYIYFLIIALLNHRCTHDCPAKTKINLDFKELCHALPHFRVETKN